MKNLLLSLSFLSTLTLSAQDGLRVYPNPFSEELNVLVSPQCGDSISIEIFDRWGRSLLKENHKVSQEGIVPYHTVLRSGIFFMRYTENGKDMTTKFLHTDSTQVRINLTISGDSLDCAPPSFDLYPNPSRDGKFVLEQRDLSSYHLAVHDMAGKILWQETVKDRTSAKHPLDLSTKPAGIYFVHVSSDKSSEVIKVMILGEE